MTAKPSNPYATPNTPNRAVETDPDKLTKVAKQLNQLRRHPPTMASMLLNRTGLPLRIVVTSLGVAILIYLSSRPQSPISSHWPVGLIAFALGSILRDFSYARVYKKWWPANMYFLDWERVDEFDNDSNNK